MMNYVLFPNLLQIPQWSQCYFDSQILNSQAQFISECGTYAYQVKMTIQKCSREDEKKILKHSEQRLLQILQAQCSSFQQFKRNQQQIVSNFVQFKVYQIEQKYCQYKVLQLLEVRTSEELVMLVQNLFLEVFYLINSTRYNLSYQFKLINKLNSQFHSKQINHHLNFNPRLRRINKFSYRLAEKIQFLYDLCICNKNKGKIKKMQNMKLSQRQEKYKIYYSLLIGLVMGVLCSFLAILLIINQSNHIGLGANKIFTAYFPVWRGACQLTFYFWILSLDIFFYEKSQINHKIIFHFEKYSFPNTTFFFIQAALLSFILLLLMMLFFFQIDGTMSTGFINYGQIFWIILLVYIFQPFPFFNHKGRYYALKIFFRGIAFCFFNMNFFIIWLAEQLVSLTQPMSDLFYTIFYFCSKSGSASVAASANFNSAIVSTIFLLRICQNFKLFYQTQISGRRGKINFWAPPFLGFIRAIFGLITAITSIVFRLKLFQNAFALWVVIIVTSTLVAWFVDVKGDWGLLEFDPFCLLRNKLLFPNFRPFYYFIIAFNLILRTAWVLTISPFFLQSTGIDTALFVMMISFLQIFRRGIWNILRIQFEHIRNCAQFQATTRDNYLLQIVKQNIKIKNSSKKIISWGYIQNNHTEQIIKNDRTVQNVQRTQRQIKSMKQMIKNSQQLKVRIKAQESLFRKCLGNRARLKKQILDQFEIYQHEFNLIKSNLLCYKI